MTTKLLSLFKDYVSSRQVNKGLLEHRVQTLRLREDAPFPQECFDHKEMIKSWQRHQRMHLIKEKKHVAHSDK